MKNSLIRIILLPFFLLSQNLFADVIHINGSPFYVVTTQNGQHILPHLPSPLTSTAIYYYLMIDKKERICFTNIQPNLKKFYIGTFNFKLDRDSMKMACYKPDRTYVDIRL